MSGNAPYPQNAPSANGSGVTDNGLRQQWVSSPSGLLITAARNLTVSGAQTAKLDTIEFDPDNNLKLTAGSYQYIAPKAGVVLVLCSICVNKNAATVPATGDLSAMIYKNGSAYRQGQNGAVENNYGFPVAICHAYCKVAAGDTLEPAFNYSFSAGTPQLWNDGRLTYCGFQQQG